MRFFVAHQTEGRTRLRAAERPVDAQELLRLTEPLGDVPGVEEIDCRTMTGSLVIEHPDRDWSELAAEFAPLGVVIVSAPDRHPGSGDALVTVRTTVAQVDTLVARLTAGGLDMRTLAFVLMLGLALRQILRGQIMVPAMSFLWYASEILLKSSAAGGEPTEGGAD